jgi:hypothetical protein
MRFAVPVLLLLAALPRPAAAGFFSGNEIYESCNAPSNTAGEGTCIGFVAGVAGASQFFFLDRPGRFCMPSSVTLGQLKDVFLKYLRENPARRNQDGSLLVILAIQEAWPCPK